MIITDKTATNKSFTATTILLGNQGRYGFNWAWKVPHPTLHGMKTIHRL
jgi:hypothetical protein